MVLLTRWMVTLASFYIMVASCGSLNTFSLFSQHIRDKLGYNQESINTIGFFKETGTSVGIVVGVIYNLSGPRAVLLLSSILNLFSFSITWVFLTGRLAAPPVWLFSGCICLVGASAAFTITAVLVPCAHNFASNQGTILSLLDSTNGLAVGIFTLAFQSFYSRDVSSFVFMLGWLPSAIMLVLLFMVKQLPDHHTSKPQNDLQNMYWLLWITVLLAFYLMLIILFQEHLNFSIDALRLSFAGSMLLLFLPIPIILYSEHTSSFSEVPTEEIWKIGEKEPLISCEEKTQILEDPGNNLTGIKYGDHYTIAEALCSMDLWLIVIATTCGVGAALTVINNLGQIGLSLGYTRTQTNTFVALLSIWDYLGGVATGALSDILLKKYGVPRPFFFALSLGIISAGNLVLGLNFMPQTLLIGSVLIGLSLGGQWAVLFTIIAEIFGLNNYATLQNIPTIAKAVGMYLLSVNLAGLLYDQGAHEANGMCVGTHCFRSTFLVMAAACMFGCIASAILTFRTSKFYRNVVRCSV